MDKDLPFMTTNELRLLAYARSGLTPSSLPAPPNKPWRVTRYKTHWYWGFPLAATYREAHFRWYWQANAVSFIYHHLFGYSCNTWKRKDPGTETARG